MKNMFRNQCPISEILNPVPHTVTQQQQLLSPSSSVHGSGPSTPALPTKKLKGSKDGASFIENAPQGEVRYLPFEDQPGELASKHKAFKLYPMGSITKYCRHIPYTSEKKSFMRKTGRKSFEGKTEVVSLVLDRTDNLYLKYSSIPFANLTRIKSTSCYGTTTSVL